MRGTRIVAHVVLKSNGSAERLRAFCVRELPRYLQPGRYEVRDALPLLPNGKHDIQDRKSTRLNSSHRCISYAVFCLKKKNYKTAHYRKISSLCGDRLSSSCCTSFFFETI